MLTLRSPPDFARSTAHANSAIRHLTNIQVITTDEEDRRRPKALDSGPLLLSSAAQKRLYCPDGIQSHHHATQFLTFSPPFDVKFQTMDTITDDVHSTQGSNVSSIGLSSIQGQMVDDLIASLRRTREQAVAVPDADRPRKPRNEAGDHGERPPSLVVLSVISEELMHILFLVPFEEHRFGIFLHLLFRGFLTYIG